MHTANTSGHLGSRETVILSAGFWLVGVTVAVTAASCLMNMEFSIQFLVWIIGAAFGAVALLAMEWPRALRHAGSVPAGRLRTLLLFNMPFAYALGSQVCGTGLKACGPLCHATNLAGIGLSAALAYRVHRGQSIAGLLVPLIVVSLVPHCVCNAPVNVLWHKVFAGTAPTCGVVPLAAVLFSLTALLGLRTRASAGLAAAMLAVIAFIAIGNPLVGFPWRGCV